MSDKKELRVQPLSETHPMTEIFKPGYKIDVGANFKKNNPEMCNTFRKNKRTGRQENYQYWATYYAKNERSMAYGFPMTFALQGGIFYLCAVYTAREQGLITKSEFVFNFAKSHWFDWTKCLKRFGVFGVAGGLVLGSIFFGDPSLAIARWRNRYQRLTYSDPTYGFMDGLYMGDTTK